MFSVGSEFLSKAYYLKLKLLSYTFNFILTLYKNTKPVCIFSIFFKSKITDNKRKSADVKINLKFFKNMLTFIVDTCCQMKDILHSLV